MISPPSPLLSSLSPPPPSSLSPLRSYLISPPADTPQLEPWDVARLARVSQRVKRAVEPHLYESIHLRPNCPHGFSYSYLSHLLAALHCKANTPKLRKWTKSLRIGRGWEENQILLLDNRDFLADDAEIIDPASGRTLVTREQMQLLVHEEGLIGDGGLKEVNAYVSDILERTPHLRSFTCDSAIPLRWHLLSTLASATPAVSSLSLDLSQPTRRLRGGRWAAIPKYRPCIDILHALPLVSLRLGNLPTRGGEWWTTVWSLLAASADSLRELTIEMPYITRDRYRDLFDRYHRIYHVPAHDDDERHLKTPPVFDGAAVRARARARGGKLMRLHTLRLAGFVVDESVLAAIAPGALKRLVLAGCVEKAGFRFSAESWRALEVFRCTGMGFVERAVEALTLAAAADGDGPRAKEIAFLPDAESPDAEALQRLRGVVIAAFPPGAGAGAVGALVLKEGWKLRADEIERVFWAAGALQEVALAVDDDDDGGAWRAFLAALGRCPVLRRVHVLNGFSDGGGGAPRRRGGRYVVDDAARVAGALVEAWEAGERADLHGVVVAVRRAAWRIVAVEEGGGGGGWGLQRIAGMLEQVVVGSYEGRGDAGL